MMKRIALALLSCAATAAHGGMFPDSTSFSASNNVAPTCTASAPATGMAGTPFAVSASCSPAATSYTWTATAGTLPVGASSNITPAAAGSYTYTVVGSNAYGAGLVSAPVSVNVAASTPVCTVSASSTTPAVSTPFTVVATCSGSPTNYDWTASTAPSKPAAGAASGSITISTPGSYVFTAKGYNTSGWGAPASITVTVKCNTSSQSQTVSCAAGYTGSITQMRDFTCPAATWGAWYTTSNTCALACSPTSQTQSIACAAGYTGSITQKRDYTCPSAAWGSWYTTSYTCSPLCNATSQTQTLSCAAGYTGSITQQRDYTCPAAAWGAWYTTSSSCTATYLYRVGYTNCSTIKGITSCNYAEFFSTGTTPPAKVAGNTYSAVDNLGVYTGGGLPSSGSCSASAACTAPGKTGYGYGYLPYAKSDPRSNILWCQAGIECSGGT